MRQQSWQEFEEYVSRIYRRLGYDTSVNTSIGGQQIDIVAEKFLPGIGRARLLIECKYKSKGSVSNQEVFELQTVFNSTRTIGRFTNAVLVTNAGFSKDARAAAESSGVSAPIHLRTITDLEDEVLNLSDSLFSYILEYEGSSIASNYVPLSAFGQVPHRDPARIESLEHEICSWIKTKKPGFLTILADFGSGKSTLLRRIKYVLSKERLESVSHSVPIPVFFTLRDLRDHHTLDTYLDVTLKREFGKQIPQSIFWKFLEKGAIVLLLDGFDEIASQSDVSKRRSALLRLSPLISRNARASILTCRPQFFVSAEEYNQILSELEIGVKAPLLATAKPLSEKSLSQLQRLDDLGKLMHRKYVSRSSNKRFELEAATSVHIEGFSHVRIDEYLKSHDDQFRDALGVGWSEIGDYLRGVYDLSDLLRRPLLLDMIVSTVLTGKLDVKDKSAQVNTARLYEIYTSIKLEIEGGEEKGRLLLSSEERQEYAELMALYMHTKGVASIGYREFLSLCASTLEQSDGGSQLTATPEQVATDVRLCSFLTIDSGDQYCFVHKSFMEFFLARRIKGEIDSDTFLRTLTTNLPAAVLHFLGSFLALDDRLKETIQERYKTAHGDGDVEQVYRQNIIAALLHSGGELASCRFQDARISRMSFERNILKWIQIKNIDFDNCVWSELVATECNIIEVSFSDCSFALMSIEKSQVIASFESIRVRELRLIEARFECLLNNVRADSVTVENSTLNVAGMCLFGNAHFENSTLCFGYSGRTTAFKSGVLKRCIVTTSWRGEEEVVDWSGVRFNECSISCISARRFVEIRETPAGRKVSLAADTFVECSGVLLYSGADLEVDHLLSDFQWVGRLCLVNVDRCILRAASYERLRPAEWCNSVSPERAEARGTRD